MEKLTFAELKSRVSEWTTAIIVFKTGQRFSNTLHEREYSYQIFSTAKYFDSSKNGTSLFGDCLDGTDEGARLDYYIKDITKDEQGWEIDYCYIPLEMELINYFDVWGNAGDEDGTDWDINNQCSEGNVLLKSTSKEHVLEALIDKGFIKESVTLDDLYVCET